MSTIGATIKGWLLTTQYSALSTEYYFLISFASSVRTGTILNTSPTMP